MAAFVIAMMTATADGGRSLYGISRTGGTVRQLGVLNRYGVPGRALTTDMLINITVLIVLGEPIAILLASNLGYLTAVTLPSARSSFSAETNHTFPDRFDSADTGFPSPAYSSRSTSSPSSSASPIPA